MNNSNPRHWLLIRGLGRGSAHWMGFAHQLHALFPEDIVETIDLPGNGKKYQESSPTNIKAMTEHYRSAISHRNSNVRVHIVAISLGGMVALDWLNRYPSEIAQCFVINSSNGAFSSSFMRFRQGAIFPILRGKLGGKNSAERAIINLTCNIAKEQEVASHFIHEASRHPVSSKNMISQIKAAAHFKLRSVQTPEKLHLICSDKDRLVSPACSKSMAMYWNVPLSIHPEAGHDLPLDDAQWLVEVIQKNVAPR